MALRGGCCGCLLEGMRDRTFLGEVGSSVSSNDYYVVTLRTSVQAKVWVGTRFFCLVRSPGKDGAGREKCGPETAHVEGPPCFLAVVAEMSFRRGVMVDSRVFLCGL